MTEINIPIFWKNMFQLRTTITDKFFIKYMDDYVKINTIFFSLMFCIIEEKESKLLGHCYLE